MSITKALRNYRNYRQTLGTLRSLDARQLEDIGLVPGDIDRVAYRSFR